MTGKDLRDMEAAAKRYNGVGQSTALLLIAEIRRLRSADALESERLRGAQTMRQEIRTLVHAATLSDRPAKSILAAIDALDARDDE